MGLSYMLSAFILVCVYSTALEDAKAVIAKMTLDEKIAMLHGTGGRYTGQIDTPTRLGVPTILMNDGPQGFRSQGADGTSTAFPSGLTIAASWDPKIAYMFGKGMGEEFRKKGSNVQLGPGMNVARVPRNGRNFEYCSGEDPVLGVAMAPQVIRGIQDAGVIANAKHFINNNQETNRESVNEVIDIRTHMELYAPPFEASVKAGVGSIMCSYNKITIVGGQTNKTFWACENKDSLTDELRKDWGFRGWVMSDWGGTHSFLQAWKSGLDQEMPGSQYFNANNVKAGLGKKTITMDELDEKMMNILYPMFELGITKITKDGDSHDNVTSPQADALARTLSAQSTVLLKNEDNLLPLDEKINIAVIGDAGDKAPIVHGGGSGSVVPPYIVTGLQGIRERSKGKVIYCETWDHNCMHGAANTHDVMVVFAGTSSSEGADRKDLSLNDRQLSLIAKCNSISKKVIVVISTPGAVLMPFSDDVQAIVLPFMPGQEFGHAIADVLFGDYNPSGKLPLTMPNVENEQNFTESQWPGINLTAIYSERLVVGYRWYDHHNVKPRFRFGFGLSYSKFDISVDEIASNSFHVQVTNTGNRTGAEVAQVYLGFPIACGEPPKLLKWFQKFYLRQGEKQSASFSFSDRDLSIFNPKTEKWEKQHGTFTLHYRAGSDVISDRFFTFKV